LLGLLADSFTETHYLKDGTDVILTRNYTGHCYYHGTVQGYPDSAVSLSTCSGLRGLILFENKTYILEPLENATSEHKIYQAENLKIASGSCGNQFNVSGLTIDDTPQSSQAFASRHKRETLKITKYVELVIVADNREFQRQGKDVEKVKQRLIEIANYVDKFYRPLNIRVALVGVEVWNDMDKCSITQDPFTSLHEFLDWRKLKLLPRKPHDNAQLVSGVYFQGTTIGMAPIMSMCTAEQSGGVVMDHSDSPLGAAVTLAHELGHNFGMNHDTLERGCTCKASTDKGGCIMNPSTGYPFPMVFSSCSKKDLENSLEKGVGMCLFNLPEVKESFGGQKCGNGYVEDGEECDCGEPDLQSGFKINESVTCLYKHSHLCYHQISCTATTSVLLCFVCMQAKSYLQLKQQWSSKKTIKNTHQTKVNSAGDPYGNCGKDSKSSFAKCEPRDAKCGKIQCQGGANRPVIGTNAVSIETNIPLQEGGKILCRGTHVYLGDDMPDPGLVLAGTKCEDEKICLNRRCQNTSIFGVHECATKCHGRGVCNNKKNCHCEADWAPPHCDKPGFGGSMDSGPTRQADNRSLTIGILITILCLIVAGLIMYLKRKTLIRLLFTNKKTTIEKLRSVSPARPSSSFEPNHVHTTTLCKNLVIKPQNLNIHQRDGTRRLLPYQTIDISNPGKTSDVLRSKTPQRVLPPLQQLPCHQTVPARPLPANPSLRPAQVNLHFLSLSYLQTVMSGYRLQHE
uniref:ADAM metallopeptidase domain 12 n=1 Tax=Chelydra serpentina TaxID=8475 RepID=A0A8C3RSQ5_CHESE